MKKLIFVSTLFTVLLMTGCDGPNPAIYDSAQAAASSNVTVRESAPSTPPVPTVNKAKYQAVIDSLTKKMDVKYDDIEGITFYTPKGTPKTANVNQVQGYMGISQDKYPFLVLRIKFTTEGTNHTWLNIRKYIFKAGDKSYELVPNPEDMYYDNSAYTSWEWYNAQVATNEQAEMVVAIALNTGVKMRYVGETYQIDREVTVEEKARLKDLVYLFRAHQKLYKAGLKN